MEINSIPVKPELLEEYLESHPEFIQRWLQEKASPQTVKEVLSSCSTEEEEPGQEIRTTSNNINNNKTCYKNINSTPTPAPETDSAVAEDAEEASLIQRSRSRSKRNSITSDRFQSWLSSSSPKSRTAKGGGERGSCLANAAETLTSRFESLDENALFIELVKDISNELDIDVLCHKILVNVGFLTHAERCSIYLARGPSEQRYLVTKLLDITTESDGKI